MRLVTFNKAIYVAGTPPRANLRHEGSRHADKEVIQVGTHNMEFLVAQFAR